MTILQVVVSGGSFLLDQYLGSQGLDVFLLLTWEITFSQAASDSRGRYWLNISGTGQKKWASQKMVCTSVTHHHTWTCAFNGLQPSHIEAHKWRAFATEGRECISGTSSGLWRAVIHDGLTQDIAAPCHCQESPLGTGEQAMSGLPRHCHHWSVETASPGIACSSRGADAPRTRGTVTCSCVSETIEAQSEPTAISHTSAGSVLHTTHSSINFC